MGDKFICKKAKECGDNCSNPPHNHPHYQSGGCSVDTCVGKSTCIPVPEQVICDRIKSGKGCANGKCSHRVDHEYNKITCVCSSNKCVPVSAKEPAPSKPYFCYVEGRGLQQGKHETPEFAHQAAERLARLPDNIGKAVHVLTSIESCTATEPKVIWRKI